MVSECKDTGKKVFLYDFLAFLWKFNFYDFPKNSARITKSHLSSKYLSYSKYLPNIHAFSYSVNTNSIEFNFLRVQSLFFNQLGITYHVRKNFKVSTNNLQIVYIQNVYYLLIVGIILKRQMLKRTKIPFYTKKYYSTDDIWVQADQ